MPSSAALDRAGAFEYLGKVPRRRHEPDPDRPDALPVPVADRSETTCVASLGPTSMPGNASGRETNSRIAPA